MDRAREVEGQAPGVEIVASDAIELAVPATIIVPDRQRANPVRVYLGSLASHNSRKTMADALRRIVRVMYPDKENIRPDLYVHFHWWKLDAERTSAVRKLLLEHVELGTYGLGTAKLTLSALRGVLFQCFRLGYMDGDTYQRAKSWNKVEGGDEELAGRMLELDEIERLRGACERENAFEAAMDAAILETGLVGARIHEIGHALLTDLSDDARQLRIVGKRRKIRHVKMPDHAAAVLEGWLAQRARFPFTVDTLFVRVCDRVGGGRVSRDEPLTPWHVWDRFRALGLVAGVKFAPHDLRRTFISTALDHADLVTVQKMAGHADPRTTARYDRRPVRARDAASAAVGRALAPRKSEGNAKTR